MAGGRAVASAGGGPDAGVQLEEDRGALLPAEEREPTEVQVRLPEFKGRYEEGCCAEGGPHDILYSNELLFESRAIGEQARGNVIPRLLRLLRAVILISTTRKRIEV